MKRALKDLLDRWSAALDPAKDKYDYYPASNILEDPEAAKKLHQFLLVDSIRQRSSRIEALGTDYEVGVISIDVAPTIPEKQRRDLPPSAGLPLQ